MVSAPARRRQVEFARRRGLSCRQACRLLCVARSSLAYESIEERADAPVRVDDNASLRGWPTNELANPLGALT